MRKLALPAAFVCLISFYAMSADAQTWSGSVAAYHYVGYTVVKTTGAAGGVAGMNELCQGKFGTTAHMCTAGEYFSTSGTAKGTATVSKWVQPSVSNCYYNPSTNPPVLCEVPTIGYDNPNAYIGACTNWTSASSTIDGTAVEFVGTADGSMLTRVSCDSNLPVACCAP